MMWMNKEFKDRERQTDRQREGGRNLTLEGVSGLRSGWPWAP